MSCDFFAASSLAKNRFSKGSVVTIGNFDGVHAGHQALLQKTRTEADRLGCTAVILTFEPHPAMVLAPQRAPKRLLPVEIKKNRLLASGLDALIFEPFDLQYAALSPSDFVEKILQENLAARGIVVGYDFTFGAGRKGSVQTLRELGEKKFAVHILEPQLVEGTPASSSLIRRLISEGNIAEAKKFLTRFYNLDGEVVHGHKRGAQLGIQTANLKTIFELWPAEGVYATRTRIEGRDYDSVTNIGRNPTFGDNEKNIETHILNFNGDLYGKKITVTFIQRLRDEIRFASPENLAQQIRLDIQNTKQILQRTGIL